MVDFEGALNVLDGSGRRAVTVEPLAGGARIRLRGDDGTVAELSSAIGVAVMALGGPGVHGAVLVKNAAGAVSVHLNGRDGDITIEGADTAEEFRLAEGVEEAPPGTVMVLTDEGSVRHSCLPYDRRVAGVVSGGGDRHPGIILGRREHQLHRVPIALAGTVMCNVDASEAAILPGDLLTSSHLLGTAMRASDRNLAFGTVLGKALRRLDRGQGSMPVLVMLR